MKVKHWKLSIPSEFLAAWILMLTLGGIHDKAEVIPALGYLVCLGIAFSVSYLRSDPLAHLEGK